METNMIITMIFGFALIRSGRQVRVITSTILCPAGGKQEKEKLDEVNWRSSRVENPSEAAQGWMKNFADSRP
jgi:hypothetical protein